MRLKQWVKNTLMFIFFMALMVMASECDNDVIFVISHFVALGVSIGCVKLLMSY